MFPRILFLAAATLLVSVAGAAADDWKVSKVDGKAQIFKQGAWTPLKADDVIGDNALIHTLEDGAVRVSRGKDTLDLMAKTEVQFSIKKGGKGTIVRQHNGVVGVQSDKESDQELSVQTSFIAASGKDAIFGVQAETGSSTLVVQRGVAAVKDNLHNKSMDVKEGQSVKATAAHGLAAGAATATDPAVVAAAGAAAIAVPPPPKLAGGPQLPEGASEEVKKAILEADAKAKAGAVAKEAQEAKDRAAEVAKAAAAANAGLDKLAGDGKDADGKPLTGKAAQVDAAMKASGFAGADKKHATAEDKAIAKAAIKNMTGGGSQELDAEQVADSMDIASQVVAVPKLVVKQPQPTDPNFTWIAVDDNGKASLKSILGLIIRLDGTEAIVFWPVLLFFCMFMGMVFHMFMQDNSFGFFVNTVVSILAAFVGAGIRDLLFTNVNNITREPFITLGLVLGSVVVFMVGVAFTRMKLNQIEE